MDLCKFSKRTFNCAKKRGKISEDTFDTLDDLHAETLNSLSEEIDEFTQASEIFSSEHLPQYSEAVEELVDIAIVAMTELYRRGVDIDQALHEKMKFNEQR